MQPKWVTEGRPGPEPESETTDSNKLSLAQLPLLSTEKQLVDLFSLMDSDEIRRTFPTLATCFKGAKYF